MATKKVLIGGGTGFVGTRLNKLLKASNYHVVNISRMPAANNMSWTTLEKSGLPSQTSAVVNLAGQQFMDFTKMWTPGFKQNVRTSRVFTTRAISNAIKKTMNKPKVFVLITGVGAYEPSQTTKYDESSPTTGSDFFSRLLVEWEKAAFVDPPVRLYWIDYKGKLKRKCAAIRLSHLRTGGGPSDLLSLTDIENKYLTILGEDFGLGLPGIQVNPFDETDNQLVIIRSGVVLGREGGMIKNMILPFFLGLGGPIASGTQYLPWIHIEDLIRLVHFAIENENVKGILNGVAPQVITNAEFTKSFAKALSRPAFFTVPEFTLNFLLHEERAMMLTKGQYVEPKRTLEYGFQYNYPNIDAACTECAHLFSKN